MCRCITFFFIILGVSSTALSNQIGVQVTSDMIFPTQVHGLASDPVINPNDAGAASFSITGEPNAVVNCSIVNKQVNLITPGGQGARFRIRVRNFNVFACTQIGPTGVLNNVRVGAEAQVRANNVEGEYTGSNIFRVVYN